MDIQTVLVFILALLTINLIVVGVYVVMVLKELRATINHANHILDTADSITTLISSPMNMVSTVIGAVVQGYKAVQEAKSSIRSLKD